MIITDPSRLRVKCSETTIEEVERTGLIKEMEDAMIANPVKGIGLAAPQIGKLVRVCIIRIPEHTDSRGRKRQQCYITMINPVIEKMETLGRVSNERCLSLPGLTIDTMRYWQVTVRWLDYDDKVEKRAVFVDLEAFCVAHECDHLDGILITDRAAPPLVEGKKKVGRNDPCPCGSTKKYKKCCMEKMEG